MAGIMRIEDFESWQCARKLVCEVYKVVGKSKLAKDFAIRDQLCRAALSGMSNIAEGFARHTDRDFAHFLDIARGSLCETQSLFYVARDIGYISDEEFEHLHGIAGRAIRMVTRLTAYLRNCDARQKARPGQLSTAVVSQGSNRRR
jgi:four helix bundle protein